jgi:hypothetical protein
MENVNALNRALLLQSPNYVSDCVNSPLLMKQHIRLVGRTLIRLGKNYCPCIALQRRWHLEIYQD